MQIQFVSFALGGPVNYTGRDMASVHKGLKINEQAFDQTVQYLGQSLKKFGMTDEHITAVAMKLGGLKKDIVEVKEKTVTSCWC